MASPHSIRRLGTQDVDAMRQLSRLLADAFEDSRQAHAPPPSADYLQRLLAGDRVFVLVAEQAGEVIGGAAGHVLQKFEQERTELYLYDLVVAAARRREGVATALIEALRMLAAEIGAGTIFVQAEHGDEPAIALYERFGTGQQVLHFDLDAAAVRTG